MNNRDKDIIKRIENGEKRGDIAVEYGISKQRVQQIFSKHRAEKAYNESSSELEKLAIKVMGHGFNYQAIMCMFDKSKTYTLEDLINISTEELLKEENRHMEYNGMKIVFIDVDFYRKHIETMKKKALKIITKRAKES